MSSTYYYLIASLPYLYFDKKSPVSRDELLSECLWWLSPGDYRGLLSLDSGDAETKQGDPAFVKEWKHYDYALRDGVKAIRTIRKTSGGEKIPPQLMAEFGGIFDEPNPLARERKIEAMRWNLLDELEIGHHFDMEYLFIYFLKIKILERLALFDKEKGAAKFESLCEATYE